MGSTTPGMRGMPGVMGKVTSITGTTLTLEGHAGPGSATTTYSVDASSAKILKAGTRTASSTSISVTDIQTGDMVMVIGPVSGTSVTATTIIDGLMGHMGGMMMHGGQGGNMHGMEMQGGTPPPQQ